MPDERWADMLDKLPTLTQGQADDLKVDTGRFRVWLARTDGHGNPFPRTVYVEEYKNGSWHDLGHYDGDEGEPNTDPWRELYYQTRLTLEGAA